MPIFPKEVIQYSSEYYLDKIRVKTKVIYAVLLVSLICCMVALPYIFVELCVKARGVLKPRTSKVELFAPVSGPVIYNSIVENTVLKKGDTICVVETKLLENQLEFNKAYRQETGMYIHDLEYIAGLDLEKQVTIDSLKTEVYRSSVSELMQRLKQLKSTISKTKADYLRNRKLYDQEVISTQEFEKSKYEFELAKNNYELAKKERFAKWEMEGQKYKHEVEQVSSKIVQLEKEREQYFLKAPISGVIQQYNGVRVGSFIYANQKIAELSPDSTLIAEMYVSPTDIGYVGTGRKVKIQVDAFNYNQWGMIDGEIIEVSDNIKFINQTPFFIVKCSFNSPFLKLKNGYKGYLKKGMTVGGRIQINKRSLYQLLYDKVDNWLNPSKA